ncbi:asparaginase [Aureimonas sp. Leaf454]|uniref:asparaginase n=1 Tax=Aureimonas sp. Leaf454 TaxID=1736381 RepID=UPI0006F9675C|nr:asparaginase [Aureimonas sp. Leaf454]KQT45292.1 asparaginase [Aureimonas sp. Leaf454]
MSNNPIVAEVTRGSRVESRHRGAVAVMDAAGKAVLSLGDIDAPVFPRSAVKVFQGIPLIETGAADAFGLALADLSLAVASHSGEPGHVERAAAMLGRAGLSEEALECGCHWPFDQPVALELARSGGRPTALHNNCSGKHAGFLCTAVHCGETTAGYVGADHPVQVRARAVIEDLTGTRLGPDDGGIDGCSIPTYAAPLRGFATGFAKLVSGQRVGAERAEAGRRLIEAAMAEPWYMAGTDRACVALMEAAPGRVFAKTGAEGVFCGAIPEYGLGFALKIDDGTTRAAESAVAATIATLFRRQGDPVAEAYDRLAAKDIFNWEKTRVGGVRPTGF